MSEKEQNTCIPSKIDSCKQKHATGVYLFGERLTMKVLNERVMCEDRWTLQLLEHLGLKEFNVYEILKKTHGVDVDDFSWIRFSGEDIAWDDVKVRE